MVIAFVRMDLLEVNVNQNVLWCMADATSLCQQSSSWMMLPSIVQSLEETCLYQRTKHIIQRSLISWSKKVEARTWLVLIMTITWKSKFYNHLCTYFLGTLNFLRWLNKNNGDEIPYTKWYPGQPDVASGAEGNCVVANYPRAGTNSKWDDVGCSYAAQFVCEFWMHFNVYWKLINALWVRISSINSVISLYFDRQL